jgi:hypothetical protein
MQCGTSLREWCIGKTLSPRHSLNPPGRGLSPASINVVWGLFNLLIGYILYKVSKLTSQEDWHVRFFHWGYTNGHHAQYHFCREDAILTSLLVPAAYLDKVTVFAPLFIVSLGKWY